MLNKNLKNCVYKAGNCPKSSIHNSKVVMQDKHQEKCAKLNKTLFQQLKV